MKKFLSLLAIAATTALGFGATPRAITVDQATGALIFPIGSVVYPVGAVADGTTNDTAAIQAAINTGKHVDLLGKSYACSGLTQSTNGQTIFSSSGVAKLIKNANGTILACTGSTVQIRNVGFRGDLASPTFTGDGVTFTGADCALINCGSRWCSGRPVKATGQHFSVVGTCDIYQTTDATGTGYDIEIGVSGTSTLYHHLSGFNSTQATGGILLTDTGSATISDAQFGKLYIKSGTSPAGVNGGATSNCRILGAINVEISNAHFTGCALGGAGSLTFAVGTSGSSWDASNLIDVGATVSGSFIKHVIELPSNDGTYGFITYGDGTSLAKMGVNPTSGEFQFPQLTIPNATNAILTLGKSVGGASGSQLIKFQDNTVDRWYIANSNSNSFSLNRYNSSGVFVDQPIVVNPSTGAIAFANAITAPTINGNTITTGTGTLTLAAGKTLTASNTLAFTGTDGSSVNFGAGGTVVYSGLAPTLTSPVTIAGTTSSLLTLNSNTGGGGAAQAVIQHYDNGVVRWNTGKDSGNGWKINRFDASGVFVDSPISVSAAGLISILNVVDRTGGMTKLIRSEAGGGVKVINTTGDTVLDSTTDSTDSVTGSLITAGGVGIAKALNVGTTLGVTGNATIGGTISGDGSGLTNINAANVSGTFGDTSISGTLTLEGSTISTPYAITGGVIQTDKRQGTATITANTAFTYSAVPPTWTTWGLFLTADTVDRTITIPSTISNGVPITSFTLLANKSVQLLFQRRASSYEVFLVPFTLTDTPTATPDTAADYFTFFDTSNSSIESKALLSTITSGVVSDTAYSSAGNGVTTIAWSKNVLYDILHVGDTDDDGKADVVDIGTAGLVRTTSGGVISSAELTGDVNTSGSNATTVEHSVTFSVSGAGSALTTGVQDIIVPSPYAGTFTRWVVSVSPADTITFDILRAADGGAAPSTSVVGGSGTKPNVASGVQTHSSTFTSWTSTTATAFDNYKCQITAVGGTATSATCTLYFR